MAYERSLVKKMKVDELIAVGGVAPPAPSSPPSAATLEEMTKIYHEMYSRGLTLFFESKWYDFKEGQARGSLSINPLHRIPSVIALFTSFIQNIAQDKNPGPAEILYSEHLEARLVWALAYLPASVPNEIFTRPTGAVPAENDPMEARGRVHVFETLVSDGTLNANPLSPPTLSNISPARQHELEFWYTLAGYLLEEHSSPADGPTREIYLAKLRTLLDGRENRDVLYSIAILREYTAQWEAMSNEQVAPSHLEESDSRCKLAVATRFIRDEVAAAHGMNGMTNVVRRFADIAYRSFVRPGLNVKPQIRKA